MWCDVDGLPFYSRGEPEIEKMNAICREVMVETLKIDSIACQESALHGLGHDRIYHAEFVEQTIDEYMAKNPNMRTALAAYAINASVGHVQ